MLAFEEFQLFAPCQGTRVILGETIVCRIRSPSYPVLSGAFGGERGGLGLMAARTRWLNGKMPASAQADSAGVEGSNPEAARMYELKVDDS